MTRKKTPLPDFSGSGSSLGRKQTNRSASGPKDQNRILAADRYYSDNAAAMTAARPPDLGNVG